MRAALYRQFNPARKESSATASEVIGQNVKRLMPDPYRREHDGYIANYARTGQPKIIGIGREVEGLRKDGSTFPLDLAVSVFHLGPRRYFTGVVRDITERKHAEIALKEANRAKDEFLAMLSHERQSACCADRRHARRSHVECRRHQGAAPERQTNT
jgi:PAS domain S-box-containing protein